MNYFLRVVLAFVSLLILSFAGQFIFRYVYILIPQNGINFGWWGNADALSFLFGVIFSFYFFLSLIIVAYFDKYKYYLLPINIIILLPMLWIFYPDWSFNGTLIGISIAGWLIGEGIVRLYKMIKKTK
ncbi:MAG: hypothetical protein WCT26_01780 [Candidatus Buchananbacteria bacterium]|jgi:hypothetical protein